MEKGRRVSAPLLLKAALAYAGRGVPVFPCEPGAKRPLIAATGHANNAVVVARRNKTGMVWYFQRVVCFLSDTEGSVC